MTTIVNWPVLVLSIYAALSQPTLSALQEKHILGTHLFWIIILYINITLYGRLTSNNIKVNNIDYLITKAAVKGGIF